MHWVLNTTTDLLVLSFVEWWNLCILRLTVFGLFFGINTLRFMVVTIVLILDILWSMARVDSAMTP